MSVYVKCVEDALEYIRAHKEMTDRKLSEALPKPQKLNPYPNGAILSQGLSYLDNMGEYYTGGSWGSKHETADTREKIIERRDGLLAALARLEEQAKPITSANAQVVEHNKVIRAKVTAMMQEMGIPDTYSTTIYVRNKPKSVSNSAGYLGDLSRNVPISDNFASFATSVKNRRAQIVAWATKATEAVAEAEAAKKANEKELRIQNFLATMRVRYELDFDAPAKEIMPAILARSPYLALAHVLMIRPYVPAINNAIAAFETAKPDESEIIACVNEMNQTEGSDKSAGRGGYIRLLNLASQEDNLAVQDRNTYMELFAKNYDDY